MSLPPHPKIQKKNPKEEINEHLPYKYLWLQVLGVVVKLIVIASLVIEICVT